MVVRKFIGIENVGRLVRCIQNGPELSRYNLIFAENGRGKTTLCAVLRSLQTRQPEHINERRTLGMAAGQSGATIRLDGTNARFIGNAWNTSVPEIAIFDATFVAQNVHAGEYVDRDHRRNLLQVIVGEAGVALAERVDELDATIRDENAKVNDARRAIQRHVPQDIAVDAFLALAADPNVDEKIVAKTDELNAAKRAAEIQTRSAPTTVLIPEPPPDLQALLAKTLADVSAEAEQLVKEQIALHEMHAGGEAWLSQGLGYIRGERCPFCGQSTSGLPLIEAYKQFFSAAYRALWRQIEVVRADAETALGEAAIATLGRTLANNDAAVEFWKQFVPIDIASPEHDHAISRPVRVLREAVIALIDRKLGNPLEAVQPDEALRAALQEHRAAKHLLEAYNQTVRSAITAVETKKAQTQQADAGAIERDLTALKLVKLRHEPQVTADCDAYALAVQRKAKLDQEKADAKDALDMHADRMIQEYESTINKLLKGFGAGFLLTNSRKTYIGGTPSSTYQILINNHAVELGDTGTPIGQPSFRTTLSSGDKSTLALAFFLAQLEHDPNKANRILVFDDPFNSQDRSRRERTAELLKKYGAECQQLFLFSHDPFFLKLVYDRLPRGERRTLQLSRAADNSTTIEEWDVEKETQEGYFRDHAALNSYLLSGARELIDIARRIRPVLEGYLRYRFPNQFPDGEWLGDMIGRIRETGAGHPLSAALEELEAINDFSKKYHHDTNPGKADAEPLNDGELQLYVKRTLAIVGGY
jgi:wobble nucleotide-excising tRNase